MVSIQKLDSEKVSLRGLPVSQSYFLPTVEEYLILNDITLRQALQHSFNTLGFGLTSGSLSNALTPEGVRFSTLRKNLIEPFFDSIPVELKNEFLRQEKSIWQRRKYHVSNTVSWSSFVLTLPEESPFRCFINSRVRAMSSAREWSANKKPDESTAYFFNNFHSKHTCIPADSLTQFSSLLQAEGTDPDVSDLNTYQKENLVKVMVEMRLDFYLGGLATSIYAETMKNEIIPRYQKRTNTYRSLVGAVLEWMKDELHYSGWNQFELDFAIPHGDEKPVKDIVEYADNKMKRWRRSTCNCDCWGKSYCKHTGISEKSIAKICELLANHPTLNETEVDNLLFRAKMMDNLHADIKKSLRNTENDQSVYCNLVDQTYCETLLRFEEYILKFGDMPSTQIQAQRH